MVRSKGQQFCNSQGKKTAIWLPQLAHINRKQALKLLGSWGKHCCLFFAFSPHIAENPGFQQYERYGQQSEKAGGQYENDIGWEGAIREFSLLKNIEKRPTAAHK